MKTKYYNLYEMLDKCQYILANSLENNLKDIENFAQYEALTEWERDYEMNEELKYQADGYMLNNQKELEKLAKKYPEKSFNDVWDKMSEELQDEIEEAIQEKDCTDIYQTFVIDEHTHDILKDYGELVYYNEDIDLHFWGVMHYGTAWSHVMNDNYPVQNHNRYIKYDN